MTKFFIFLGSLLAFSGVACAGYEVWFHAKHGEEITVTIVTATFLFKAEPVLISLISVIDFFEGWLGIQEWLLELIRETSLALICFILASLCFLGGWISSEEKI